MTICIAALADGGKSLILAADQMITANIPISYQFETDDIAKIYPLTDTASVLMAGNVLYAHEILENARRQVTAADIKQNEPQTIEQITEILRVEYQNYRRNLVVKKFIEPRGLNLQAYYQLQRTLHDAVTQEIEKNLTELNIGVELIVAGHNTEVGCHVYSIVHPGVSTSHGVIGYVCVGSGAPHATYHLIGSDYKKTMGREEVRGIVTEAKKKSEVAPGVGSKTTIVELSKKSGEEKHE